MNEEKIEIVRQLAYKRYPKRKHYLVDKALDSGRLFIMANREEGLYKPEEKKQFNKDCYNFALGEVKAELPKTGLFSFLTIWAIEALVKWVIQKLLEKYYE